MHKYLLITSKAFIATIAYRSEVVVWIIIDAIPVIVMSIIWSAIYFGETNLQGLTFSEIIVYYLLTLIIGNTIDSTFPKERVQQIREGKIDFYFTKPLSYIAEVFFTALGYRLFYMLACLPVILGVFAIIANYLDLALPSFTAASVIIFLLFLVFGYLLEFLFGMITVITGFWLEGSEGLEHFKWMVISLCSGLLVPFEFMPNWLRTINELLPFKYMYYIPINILLQKQTLRTVDAIAMITTLLFLCMLIAFMYNRARRTYSSNGG